MSDQRGEDVRRFWMGFATAWTIDKLAWAIVLSNRDIGREILSRWLGRLSHDRFMSFRDSVNAEHDRRADSF